jgi:C1A family cysteine protease
LLDTSEQFVYWNAKSKDGHQNSEGTWLHVAMPATAHEGACLEATWPYNATPMPGNESQAPPPAGAAEEAGKFVLAGAGAIGPRDSAAMRAVLDAGQPFAVSVPVYNNWSSNPAANATGLIPMPLPNSVLKGGHCMCVSGYGLDAEIPGGGYLILRNSWGTGWAPQSPVGPGYGALPFLYVDRYGWEAWTGGP